MSLVAKEINRRRHIRWKIEKHAVLFIPGSNPVSCTICDFCSSGLFLEFNQIDKKIVLQQNQQVKVFFSVSDKGGENDFQFDVEIMRVCSNGIGVAFQHIPMSAFQALVKEADLNSIPVSLVKIDQNHDQGKKKSFEKAFKILLGKSLPMVLKEFFEQVDKELLRVSEHAEIHVAKTVYFEAFTTLKSNRKLIVSHFCNSLLKEIRYIDNSRSEEKDDSLNDQDKHSVVNNDQMGDWIDLSSIIRRTESKFESQLDTLEQKLSKVTGIPASQINNPLTPAKLFYSFRAAIENPDENDEVMKAFYHIFEDILASQLEELYMQFESFLIDHGAPEQVDRNNTGQSVKLSNNEKYSDQQVLNQDMLDKQPAAQNALACSE